MDANAAVAALVALSHPLRVEVWRALAPYGRDGLSAGAISAQLDVPPSSLSFHLQQMTQGAVLSHRRSSRKIMYAVNDLTIDALCNFLSSAGMPPLLQLSPGGLYLHKAGNIVSEG